MMLQLEIHIPENGPQAAPDDAGNAAPPSFLWCLRGEQGNVQRSGKSTLDSMPSAASCQLVLPASRVLLSSIKPPAQNRKKFMQALPYAVEDRIMADPESIHVAADEVLENGEMPLAIADRAWLRQTLDTLGNHGLKPQRADVETLRAPWQARSWTLVWRGNGGFVRQGPHNGIPLDGGDAAHPPAALQMALAASDSQPDSIQLYLDGASTPDLDAWSAELGIPVILSGTWPWPGDGPGWSAPERTCQHPKRVLDCWRPVPNCALFWDLSSWGSLSPHPQKPSDAVKPVSSCCFAWCRDEYQPWLIAAPISSSP
jgi:general secretion pathway protein L